MARPEVFATLIGNDAAPAGSHTVGDRSLSTHLRNISCMNLFSNESQGRIRSSLRNKRASKSRTSSRRSESGISGGIKRQCNRTAARRRRRRVGASRSHNLEGRNRVNKRKGEVEKGITRLFARPAGPGRPPGCY